MKINHKLLLFIVIMISINTCTSSGKDFPITKGRISYDYARVKTYPDEVGAEIGENTIEGSVTIQNILGFSTTDIMDSQKNEITPILNKSALDSYTQTAAARAVQSAKADGILLIRVIKKQSGFWPLFYTDTFEVKGKPVKFKSLGTLSSERVELRKYLKLEEEKEKDKGWWIFSWFN
jgi:hypothetical protein